MPWLAFGAAAAVATAIAVWWYGRREEKVRGRGFAAVLRGAAVFFFLSAPWMPSLGVRSESNPRAAILVDHSLSMRYPAGAANGATRMETARAVAAALVRERRWASVWSFARSTTRIEPTELGHLEATGGNSRVVDAIEQARASGADTLFIVTDGELEDRETGRRLSERLGITVQEVRVSDQVGQFGIRFMTVPRMVTAGDTLEVQAEIVAAAGPGDSVRVVLEFGGVSAATKVERPAAGRSADAVFRLQADLASDSTEWRPLDVRVDGVASPWDVGARARAWVGVSPESRGAVIVSVDPDWETRYLAPVLDRSVPGGARSFLRVGDGSWIRAGPRPQGGIAESSVRRAAGAASLLVVQGDPTDLPDWLASAARRRPAVIHLVRGTGPIPGTDVSIQDVLPGEWYAYTPPPPGPVSAHLIGVDGQELPPLSRLYGSTGSADGSVLSGRRDRRGPASPIAVLGASEGRRWAVVQGEGTWRWAARGNQGLSLYRGLFAGMTRWLVERSAPQPIRLTDPYVRSGDSVRWRVAPDVRDLDLRLEDASGALVWSYAQSDSIRSIAGPRIEPGDARFVAIGTTGGTPFRIERPFYANPRIEEMPNRAGPLLDVRPVGVTQERAAPGSDPPVWPFAASIVLVCVEWLWRRRVGLR